MPAMNSTSPEGARRTCRPRAARQPSTGSVQEIRNIRVLGSGEGAALFRPDPGWTVVDAPAQLTPGALETTVALPDR